MPPAGTARCVHCDINGGTTFDFPADDLRSHVDMHISVKGANARMSVMVSQKVE